MCCGLTRRDGRRYLPQLMKSLLPLMIAREIMTGASILCRFSCVVFASACRPVSAS